MIDHALGKASEDTFSVGTEVESSEMKVFFLSLATLIPGIRISRTFPGFNSGKLCFLTFIILK
jgi:hypothetical protein